jgi:hypothetical protein
MSLGFIAVGIAMFVWWYLLLQKAKASKGWLLAPGHIISSMLTRRQDTDGEWKVDAVILYQYTVDGAALKGSRIGFSGAGVGGAKASVERYPAGANVEVFYDPQKPSAAVLERKLAGNAMVLPLVGGVLLIAGFVIR